MTFFLLTIKGVVWCLKSSCSESSAWILIKVRRENNIPGLTGSNQMKLVISKSEQNTQNILGTPHFLLISKRTCLLVHFPKCLNLFIFSQKQQKLEKSQICFIGCCIFIQGMFLNISARGEGGDRITFCDSFQPFCIYS